VIGKIQESTWFIGKGRGESGGGVHFTLRYTYEIDGVQRESSRIRLLWSTYWFRYSAKRLCKKYSKGNEVAVYVNPKDHSEAVLEPVMQYCYLIFLFMFAATLLLYAAMSFVVKLVGFFH